MPRWPTLTEDQIRIQWIQRVREQCIVTPEGCWQWPGQITSGGYGQANYRGKGNVMVHRTMYKAWHQVELTPKQMVCHSCDNSLCCNPDHLWVGSGRDNMRDKGLKGRNFFAKLTHCRRGHEFMPENTRMHFQPGKKMRQCRECERIRMKSAKYQAKALERQRRYRAMGVQHERS